MSSVCRLARLAAVLAALQWCMQCSFVMTEHLQTTRAPLRQETDLTVRQLLNAATMSLELESGWPTEPATLVAQNPPWAKCFVEARETSKSVLEEWVMRGERETVDTFRAWRQGTSTPTSVRCVETSPADAMQSTCLDCVSLSEIGFLSPGSIPAGLEAQRLFGLSQCLATAAESAGFCKSGVVSM